jgi:heparin binding hemagglutinin HbhA
MAKATFDPTQLPVQLPAQLTEAAYAGVGVTDLVVETVRDYVVDVQKRLDDVQRSVAGLEAKPEVLRDRAAKAVADGIEAFNKEGAARRQAVEKRMAELQAEVTTLPTRLQKLVDAQVATAGDTYAGLVKRGETLVGRIRGQQATQDAEAAAKTTVTKAKTTKTQATKAATSATKSAKKAASKTAKSPAASSAKASAKATATAAKKTAATTAEAVTDAAEKIGD